MANFFDFNNNFGPVEEESELIPLMTSDDEEAILKESLPESVPILPLRNAVLFPNNYHIFASHPVLVSHHDTITTITFRD